MRILTETKYTIEELKDYYYRYRGDKHSIHYFPQALFKIMYVTDLSILEDDYFIEYCYDEKTMLRRCKEILKEGLKDSMVNPLELTHIVGFYCRPLPFMKFDSELCPYDNFFLKSYKKDLLKRLKDKNKKKEAISLWDI